MKDIQRQLEREESGKNNSEWEKKIKKVGENNKIRNKIETKTVLNFDPSHVK